MATPKKFAMQGVLNLLLRNPADKSIIAYLDNLKTSGLENTLEMTYPQGGRGNVYIGAGFAHSKRATLNVETATWNTDVMAIQNGTEIDIGETEVIEYDVISYVSGEGFKTKFSAIGKEDEEIGFLYILNPDGTQGNVYTQADSLGVDNTQFLYVASTRTISFAISEQQALIDSNVKLCCAYKRMTTGDKAQKISLTATSIPSVVLVTGYGVVMDICSNVAYLCQFNGKAQVDGNYTFDLSADGDPIVQSLNLEFVRDCGVEKLYSFIIYDDDENEGGDTPEPPIPPQPINEFTINAENGQIVRKGASNQGVAGNLTGSLGLAEGQTWLVTFEGIEEPIETTVSTVNYGAYSTIGIYSDALYGWVLDNTQLTRTPNEDTGDAIPAINNDSAAWDFGALYDPDEGAIIPIELTFTLQQ